MIGYNKNEIVGKMRERVILQNRVISQSDSGFQSETYSNISTLSLVCKGRLIRQKFSSVKV